MNTIKNDLNVFQERAEHWLSKIEDLFVPGVKITLIARLPGIDDADLILTLDELEEVKKVVERRMVKP